MVKTKSDMRLIKAGEICEFTVALWMKKKCYFSIIFIHSKKKSWVVLTQFWVKGQTQMLD